jgi:hypothetical protein
MIRIVCQIYFYYFAILSLEKQTQEFYSGFFTVHPVIIITSQEGFIL